MWLVSILFVCGLVYSASSSKCPEPRKPHLTSCTIFYNCVNLPEGGYVWVPSRCTKGLVFQPYLRMCVVPGDIWTCDTLSTDPTIVTKPYQTPELIDPADTSYLGYTPNPSEFSETIDSSYVIEDDASELTTVAATAYPLIEYEEPHSNEDVKNVSHHTEENYSFEYTHSYLRVPLPLMQKYKDIVNNHNKWLSELMNQLRVYEELSTAISDSLSASVEHTTTVSSTQTIMVFASHKRKQDQISHDHIVHDYTGETQLQNDKPGELGENDESQMENIATINSITQKNKLELLINSLDPDNNVIRVSNDFRNHRYLTIDEYKAMSQQFSNESTSRFISVIACTRNIRLPNQTDCGRYYMCDPRTASVTDYSCPLHTAFNMNSRICDVESAKICSVNKPVTSDTFVDHAEHVMMHDDELSKEKPCRELGKVKDPVSDFHYYICYSTSGSKDVKSIRMTCPNVLIFCQRKKVCTTKRLCNAS